MAWHDPPHARNAVEAALQAHGPMTVQQLAEAMDWPVKRVKDTISRTRKLRPGEIFRVTGYQRATEGKGKDASIYAAEAGKDQPRMTKVAQRLKTNQARYRKKHNAIINARTRRKRSADAGQPAQVNPWAQLAPASVRAEIARIERQQRKAQQ